MSTGGEDSEFLINLIMLVVLGAVAWHAIRYRDKQGKSNFVFLLFGSIAAVYFFMILFQEVLGIVQFG